MVDLILIKFKEIYLEINWYVGISCIQVSKAWAMDLSLTAGLEHSEDACLSTALATAEPLLF